MRGANVANGSLRYMLETSLVIGAVLVVAVAGLTSGRSAALPAVGLVLAGAFRLLPALNQILFLSNQVQFNSSATDFVERELRDVRRVSDREPRITRSRDVAAAPLRAASSGSTDVTFRYPTRAEPALRGVSSRVRPGESLGIVGPTGSGKSTLLDVVLGMLEPDSGPSHRRRVGRWRSTARRGSGRSATCLRTSTSSTTRCGRTSRSAGTATRSTTSASSRRSGWPASRTSSRAPRRRGDGRRRARRAAFRRTAATRRARSGAVHAAERPRPRRGDVEPRPGDRASHRRDPRRAKGGVTMIVVTHRTASVVHCDRIVYLEGGAFGRRGRSTRSARPCRSSTSSSTPRAGRARSDDERSRRGLATVAGGRLRPARPDLSGAVLLLGSSLSRSSLGGRFKTRAGFDLRWHCRRSSS